MASILMGTLTSMIMLIIGGGCFLMGYRVCEMKPAPDEKHDTQPTEEQKRMAEGFTNLLNYANRHISNK